MDTRQLRKEFLETLNAFIADHIIHTFRGDTSYLDNDNRRTQPVSNGFMEAVLNTDESISLLQSINAKSSRFLVVKQRPSGRYETDIWDSTGKQRLWRLETTFDTAQEAVFACDETAFKIARDVLSFLAHPHDLEPFGEPSYSLASNIVYDNVIQNTSSHDEAIRSLRHFFIRGLNNSAFPVIRFNSFSLNKQPLSEYNTASSSRNHGPAFVNDHVNMHCGQASTQDRRSNAPDDQVCIDILRFKDVNHQITYQAWKEYRNQLKKSRFNDQSMKMLIEATLALGGQAIGAVMANALSSSSTSSSSCAIYMVEFAVIVGLSLTLAGISLSGKRRAWSILMTKIGAVATASAILISLGSHLQPVLAWTLGAFALLIMAVAVAFA